MSSQNGDLIESLVYPESLKRGLGEINERLVHSAKRGGLSIEECSIELGMVPAHLKVPLFMFYWVVEFNTVIGNLNMVLLDLGVLGERYVVLEGSPNRRFYLLVRMFFYEFYRFREIFSAGLDVLASFGRIKKKEVEEARQIFREAFKDTIRIRNALVHESPRWRGEEHLHLTLVNAAHELGCVLKEKKTGRLVSFEKVLPRMCRRYVKALATEGQRMSKVLQRVIDAVAKDADSEAVSGR